MKTLIFSVSAGGGHGKAAQSVKEYIELYSKESTVKIIDTLKYINPIIDKVIIGGYLKTIKMTPSLFGKLYDYSETDYGLSAISAKFNEIMTYRLMPLIKEFERSEEHTSELQYANISYAVFCLKKKNKKMNLIDC